MITATNTGKKRELIPAGSHIARCYSMVHEGTAIEDIMGEKKILNKVRITWEIPEEMREFDGVMKPLVISKEYTLSMHEKATLRKDLENWRSKSFTEEEAKSFDVTRLLGVTCVLSIVHMESKSGTVFAKIGSISPLMKGVQCPPQFNPTFEFNFTDKFDAEKLETFPDFIKDRIKASEEYKDLICGAIDQTEEEYHEPDTSGDTPDDGLPF